MPWTCRFGPDGAGIGCRSSSLLLRPRVGPCLRALSRAGACVGAGARFAAARLARLIARATQRTHVSRRLLTGFQKSAPPGRAAPGDAAPESASLGPIIPHSARCQDHIRNKIQKYRKLPMFREGRRAGKRPCGRVVSGPDVPPASGHCCTGATVSPIRRSRRPEPENGAFCRRKEATGIMGNCSRKSRNGDYEKFPHDDRGGRRACMRRSHRRGAGFRR